VLSLIDLSPLSARPSDTSVTFTDVVPVVPVVPPVSAGFWPQAADTTKSAAHRASEIFFDCIIDTLCPRNREFLSRMNQVRILDLIAVRFVDAMPLVGIAVEMLGNLRQAVSRHDNIGLALSGCARRREWRERRGRLGRRRRAA